MFKIGVVCEGDGDKIALPVLLRRITEHGTTSFKIGKVLKANGRGNLTTSGGIERFLRYVSPGHDGVLIVVDADTCCPVNLGRKLADRIRALGLPIPIAIVAAESAFEAWFLADLGSIAGRRVKGRVLIPAGSEEPGDPDRIRNPKARLIELTAGGTTYKESTDQPALASLIDPAAVGARSRSFRRLLGALRGLEAAAAAGVPAVTP